MDPPPQTASPADSHPPSQSPASRPRKAARVRFQKYRHPTAHPSTKSTQSTENQIKTPRNLPDHLLKKWTLVDIFLPHFAPVPPVSQAPTLIPGTAAPSSQPPRSPNLQTLVLNSSTPTVSRHKARPWREHREVPTPGKTWPCSNHNGVPALGSHLSSPASCPFKGPYPPVFKSTAPYQPIPSQNPLKSLTTSLKHIQIPRIIF